MEQSSSRHLGLHFRAFGKVLHPSLFKALHCNPTKHPTRYTQHTTHGSSPCTTYHTLSHQSHESLCQHPPSSKKAAEANQPLQPNSNLLGLHMGWPHQPSKSALPRTVPRLSLTSRVANSQDSEGKLHRSNHGKLAAHHTRSIAAHPMAVNMLQMLCTCSLMYCLCCAQQRKLFIL